jgi:hypothetical protein
MEARIAVTHRARLRCCMVALALAAPVGGRAVAQTTAPSIRVTPENVRFNNYLRDLAAPPALVGIVGGSLLQQIRPNQGARDLEDAIAMRAAQHTVQVSVRHGLAALMHRRTDHHYQPCDCHGLGPRLGHALVETFTDQRADGSRALAVPRIAGTYAGGFASLAWKHDRGAGDVAAGATLSLGFSALFNVAREFTGLGVRHAPDRTAAATGPEE